MTITSASSLADILTDSYTAPDTSTTDSWAVLELPTAMADGMANIGTW